jgi:hypothetical protein
VFVQQRAANLQVNNIIYVFGGQLVKDGAVSNELFWMTSERMEWHLQPTRGDRPVGRHGHVAIYDPDHHQLVVFGGRCVGQGVGVLTQALLVLLHCWTLMLCSSQVVRDGVAETVTAACRPCSLCWTCGPAV